MRLNALECVCVHEFSIHLYLYRCIAPRMTAHCTLFTYTAQRNSINILYTNTWLFCCI